MIALRVAAWVAWAVAGVVALVNVAIVLAAWHPWVASPVLGHGVAFAVMGGVAGVFYRTGRLL